MLQIAAWNKIWLQLWFETSFDWW